MISTQMGCTMETAIFLLEKRADLVGCSVGDLARAVIDRRVRFAAGGSPGLPPARS
jgi:hypothetical protein